MYFYYYRLLVQVEQNKPMVVASLDANQWNKSSHQQPLRNVHF